MRRPVQNSRPGILRNHQYPAVSPGAGNTGRNPAGKQDRPGKPCRYSPVPIKDSHNVRSGRTRAPAGSLSTTMKSPAAAGNSSCITSTPGSPRAVLRFVHACCAACATHTRITCMSSSPAMHSASAGVRAIRRIFVVTRCLKSRGIVIRLCCKILHIYFVVECGLRY